MTQPRLRTVHLGTEHYRGRVQQVQAALQSHDLEGILLLDAANIMWVSGFFHIPNERPLGLYVPAAGDPMFYAPFLEKENAGDNAIAAVRCYWEFPGSVPPEVWMMQQIGEQRIAVDGVDHGRFLQMQAVKPALQPDAAVNQMRYVKDEAELALIEVAANFADFGLAIARDAVAEQLHSGITELDVVQIVQSETVAHMRHQLDDLINFYRGAVALTAHTGPRAALPHGQPGPIRVRPGDTLIVGIGVKVGAYHAESGCTFIIGDPSAEQQRCLEAAWACDQAAVDALRPSNSCTAVNDAALAVLRDAGLGDAIRHRIGHGMGIEGHEAPWLSEGDETVLQTDDGLFQ